MKNNELTLEFDDKTLPTLAGYPYGESVFREQIKDKIDYTADKIIISFPDYKSVVASSFVEGFFNEIKENIGIKNIYDKVVIKSNHQKLIDKIWVAIK